MIFDAIKRLFLPSPGSSAEARAGTGTESPLPAEHRHKFEAGVAGSNPAPGAISRRSFFSFCTAATILAVKPGLWLPKAKPIEYVAHIGWKTLPFEPGLRKEFAEAYKKAYEENRLRYEEDGQFYYWVENAPRGEIRLVDAGEPA